MRPSKGIKYRLKTFDDEVDSDTSFNDGGSGDDGSAR
jgi:hypothetical protein